MRNSYTSLDEAREHGLTAVHKYWFGFPIETDGEYPPGLAPTGSIYASASDVARYLSMYLQGGAFEGKRLLSKAGIDAMLSVETNQISRSLQSHEFSYGYGRGWFVGEFGAAKDARWHLGNLPYFTAWMVLLPETNQAVVVLINAGSQFEIAGANEVMSRIPIGVVNILRGEEPPTGAGMARFFLIFSAFAIAIVAAQTWSLLRLARRPLEQVRGVLAYVPFAWEAGAGAALLLGTPAVFGMSWQHSLQSIPDLTLVLLTVSLLWLATAVIRTTKLVLRLTARHSARPAAPKLVAEV
jgi:CubicO group peptidase (beta-lactamase class C family)